MKRTAGKPADPTPESVHVNGSSRKSPKRKWKPEVERDRSMRAYEQNPRAFRCNPCECGGSDACPRCNPTPNRWSCHGCLTWNVMADDFCVTCGGMRP